MGHRSATMLCDGSHATPDATWLRGKVVSGHAPGIGGEGMSPFGRTLSRYVFRQTAGALLLILMSLTTIVWIGVALRQLELMTNQGQDAGRFLIMTALAIPSLLALIAPIALLIAGLHVLNRLNGDSELIVMTAGGAPVWALFKPLGLLALLVVLGVATVNHVVGPWSQRLLREYTVLVRTDLIAQVIQPWRFTEPEPRLTIHIRDRAPNGDLLGLLLHDARDPKQVASYLAERAQILKQGGEAFLRMKNGHVVSRAENDKAPRILAFTDYVADLNQLEQRPELIQLSRPRERYTTELLELTPDDPLRKVSPGRIASDLHERFASPLYAFAFLFIVLAFAGSAQTTRQSRLNGLVAAFGAGVLCRMLGIAANNAVAVRPGAAFVIYAIPVASTLIAVIATQRQSVPRPRSRPLMIVDEVLDGLRARLGRLFARRASRPQARWAQEGRMLASRTLRRYVARRFLVGIVGAFAVCACLIFMIDMIELLRLSRRAQDLSVAMLLWIGLLRLPAFTELLLAFAVLVGSIAALLSLNRKSELTVMRSAGMSVWQFLRPGLVVTFLLGIVAVALFNPLAASARFEAERLVADVFGMEAGLLATKGDGSWLRQDGPDGQSVVHARAVANQGLSLSGVVAYVFDRQGRFVERLDAERATLQDGYWELQKTVVSRPKREAEVFSTYSLSTRLTRERVSDALGSEIAVSFWQLPELIEESERAGLSASKYRMQHAILLSRPALLLAMVVLAATVSLRSFRSGGIQTMVLLGMVGGIGLFLLAEVSRQIGASGLIAPALAVWVPIAVSLLVSLTVLLHQEDG
jgi:lipopolysaccharide export system permease protein